MGRLLSALKRHLLTKEEIAAFDVFRSEIRISGYHRAGLRQMRRMSWARPKRLNLGSGSHGKKGYLNVDIHPGADLTLDIRKGLPFDSNCCETIFSEHFFEHLDYPEPVRLVFRECLRVLVPGGLLRFSVPDTAWPLHDYGKSAADAEFFVQCEVQRWHSENCTTRMEHINYHFRQNNEHRFAYDEETARKILEEVGFQNVRRSTFDPSIDSPHREIGSLFMTALKPVA